MTGTEKQIAFATDLLDNMNQRFDELLSDCPDDKKPYWINVIKDYNTIMDQSYAGDIIDLLKDIYEKDYYEYYVEMGIKVRRYTQNSLCKRIKKEIFEKYE